MGEWFHRKHCEVDVRVHEETARERGYKFATVVASHFDFFFSACKRASWCARLASQIFGLAPQVFQVLGVSRGGSTLALTDYHVSRNSFVIPVGVIVLGFVSSHSRSTICRTIHDFTPTMPSFLLCCFIAGGIPLSLVSCCSSKSRAKLLQQVVDQYHLIVFLFRVLHTS